MIREIIATIFLISGVGFMLIATLGALRFPDPLTRMSAVAKASTLGITLIFSAVITMSLSWGVTFKAILTIGILWFSAPIAAHLIARASVLTGERICPTTKNTDLIDEIKDISYE